MSKNFGTIPGKITVEESIELAKLAKDRNVIQIGCYCGRATIPLALAAKRLWVLDDFVCTGAEAIVGELKHNVTEAGVDDKISFLHGDGLKCVAVADPPTDITLVYRDANRSESNDNGDAQFVANVLGAGGGIYAWHGHDGKFLWMQFMPKEEAA